MKSLRGAMAAKKLFEMLNLHSPGPSVNDINVNDNNIIQRRRSN